MVAGDVACSSEPAVASRASVTSTDASNEEYKVYKSEGKARADFPNNDSRNLAALSSFPERIPVFTFHYDGIGLHCGLHPFEFVRADDR
jgi:hypothetical protein